MRICDAALRTGFQTTIGPNGPRKSRGPPSPCATAARLPEAASATIGRLVAIVRVSRKATRGSLGAGVPVTVPATQTSGSSEPSSGNPCVTGRWSLLSTFTVQSRL